MATKEDILEQIVEEYLLHCGYFVRHNLKFRPRSGHPDFIGNQDSNHSDIDVIGFHPRKRGSRQVLVVSCKSWQGGFSPRRWIEAIKDNKTLHGRPAWKTLRELTEPKWSEAFLEAVRDVTGTGKFTYVTAVNRLEGDKSVWEQHKPFSDAIGRNPVEILTFSEMVARIQGGLSTALAGTEVGRMLQLFKAAGVKVPRSRLEHA